MKWDIIVAHTCTLFIVFFVVHSLGTVVQALRGPAYVIFVIGRLTSLVANVFSRDAVIRTCQATVRKTFLSVLRVIPGLVLALGETNFRSGRIILIGVRRVGTVLVAKITTLLVVIRWPRTI